MQMFNRDDYDFKPLVLITGNTGAGKDTLVHKFLSRVGFKFTVSTTDRPVRSSDIVDGPNRTYNFVSTQTFNDLTNEGKFLYTTKIHGHNYGVSLEDILNSDGIIVSKESARTIASNLLNEDIQLEKRIGIVLVELFREVGNPTEILVDRGDPYLEIYNRKSDMYAIIADDINDTLFAKRIKYFVNKGVLDYNSTTKRILKEINSINQLLQDEMTLVSEVCLPSKPKRRVSAKKLHTPY